MVLHLLPFWYISHQDKCASKGGINCETLNLSETFHILNQLSI